MRGAPQGKSSSNSTNLGSTRTGLIAHVVEPCPHVVGVGGGLLLVEAGCRSSSYGPGHGVFGEAGFDPTPNTRSVRNEDEGVGGDRLPPHVLYPGNRLPPELRR